MIRLLFDLSAVKTLADHAAAAPGHRASYSDTLDGTTPAPALLFAGDEGLYLMSNGLPHLPNPANSASSLVAYAAGFDTSMSKHAVAHLIGGDDFSEVLPLLEKRPDGRTLHDDITDAVAAGATRFAIEIDTTHLTPYVVTAGQEETR